MSLKNSFPNNPRARMGTRFIPANGPAITMEELLALIQLTGAIRVEHHFADGEVYFNASGRPEVMLARAKARGGDFRTVLITPDGFAFPHVNFYGVIIMDEQAAREDLTYPAQHLSCSGLFERLTSGRLITLLVDDYLHRLAEIKAAQTTVEDPATAKAIGAFAAKIETYKAGELKVLDPNVPLSEDYVVEGTEALQIMKGTRRCNYIPKLQPPEIAPAPRLIPYSQPIAINVPPQPRVPFKIAPTPAMTPDTEPPAKAKPAAAEPKDKSLAQPGQTTMPFDF